MATAKAITKYVRVSPRKARLAAGLIRGLEAQEAMGQLVYANTKAGHLLAKTLKSAMANAEMELDARPEELRVSEVLINEGPRMKRAKPRNKGGKHPIIKRTSHLTVVVSKE